MQKHAGNLLSKDQHQSLELEESFDKMKRRGMLFKNLPATR